ncbi:hypothetical protein [Lederbergia lenta]|uniref:hypothetical protein n=1 Tax=Lederbergia lenta TaxID=1467 RepID=UPI000825D7F3|nr:hypothetical protein [Lederbergia lenta]MCM3111042.1 hypothetical protein [Lederbergia lenta]MEC2325570.1 hypothetical protein [Lederbergia lenta]
MTGIIAVVMIFSIPIIAIVTDHVQKSAKTKSNIIKEEIELEKLKHENFLLETEKLRLELEQMQLDHPKEEAYKLTK